MLRRLAPCAILLGVLICTALAASDIENWQGTKPLRFEATAAPGGLTDIVPRLLSNYLSASVGVPVLVENRPGGGGNIAAGVVAKAERDGHTLQTTELINELYLRLSDLKLIDWQNRAHFFALCARQMRRILTDQARARRSHKRGDGAKAISLDDAVTISPEPSADLVAVDDALNQLAKVDERKSQVVVLRFFGGLNVEETAEVLKVSPETVARDWRLAKAWLMRALSENKSDET